MELSVPLLAFLRQGELHVEAADQVFEGPRFHLQDKCPERLREQVQLRLFPTFGFFEVFSLACLCGKRTGSEACECFEDPTRVVTVGNALENVAEVFIAGSPRRWQLIRPHHRPAIPQALAWWRGDRGWAWHRWDSRDNG